MRSATASDIGGMHAVRLAVHENRLSDPARVTPDHYREMLEVHGHGWVHEEGGEIVGFGVLDLTRRNIWALFVAPRFEGRGIGSALLTTMVELAFRKGSEPVWLTTMPSTRAERFYRAAGWRQTGVTERGELRFELAFPAAAGPPGG